MSPQAGNERLDRTPAERLERTRTLIVVLAGIGLSFLVAALWAIGALSFLWNHLLWISVVSAALFGFLVVMGTVVYILSPRAEQNQSQQIPPDETPTTKGQPYNLYFAVVCVVVGAGAYVLTMLIFRGLIKALADVAIVSGALGVLFTFIGTLAGAYFGIKSTQDTTDKMVKQREEEAERTERANQTARSAQGAQSTQPQGATSSRNPST